MSILPYLIASRRLPGASDERYYQRLLCNRQPDGNRTLDCRADLPSLPSARCHFAPTRPRTASDCGTCRSLFRPDHAAFTCDFSARCALFIAERTPTGVAR